jgi:hypothetical protein
MSISKLKVNFNRVINYSSTKDNTEKYTDDSINMDSSFDSEVSDISFTEDNTTNAPITKKSYNDRLYRFPNHWMKLYYIFFISFKDGNKLGEIKLRLTSLISLTKIKKKPIHKNKLLVSRIINTILNKNEINETNNPLKSSFIFEAPKLGDNLKQLQNNVGRLKRLNTCIRGFKKSNISTAIPSERVSRDTDGLKGPTRKSSCISVVKDSNNGNSSSKPIWAEIFKLDELHKPHKYLNKEQIFELTKEEFTEKFAADDLNSLKHDIKAYERLNISNYMNKRLESKTKIIIFSKL